MQVSSIIVDVILAYLNSEELGSRNSSFLSSSLITVYRDHHHHQSINTALTHLNLGFQSHSFKALLELIYDRVLVIFLEAQLLFNGVELLMKQMLAL